MKANWSDRGVDGWAQGEQAVAAYERVLMAAMKHKLILRVSLYTMACVLLLVSAGLIVFAPDGRETAVTIISLSLFIVAAGCAGFATFKLKLPGVDLKTAGGDHDVPSDHAERHFSESKDLIEATSGQPSLKKIRERRKAQPAK